ncbi:MAG: serine/threonine-protein kinase, partial [bacterium]
MGGEDKQPRRQTSRGKKSLGGFEIIGEIGRGAMGAVFEARQVSMDRIIALKVLPPRFARDKAFVQRFLREARSAAHLNHPNIVRAITAGHEGAYYYFAMEFVDGPSVGRVLDTQGALSQRRALEIARDMARALAHAHQHDFVHRDVKPDNILLAPDGTAMLSDLGLARKTNRTDSRVTQAGETLGTPDYIAPEQAEGSEELDGRTDVYSLGATFYHLVTGRPPYKGKSNVDIMYQHIHGPIPDPREVDPHLSDLVAEIIQKSMAKRPDRRYQSAEAMLADIERALQARPATSVIPGEAQGEPGAAQTIRLDRGAAKRTRRAGKKAAMRIGGGAALVAALAVLLWLGLRPGPQDKPPPDPSDIPAPSVPGRPEARDPLDEVAAWVEEHPDDFTGALRRYDALIAALHNAARKAKAGQARADVQDRYRKAAEAAVARRVDAAYELAQAGDYDAAIRQVSGLDPQYQKLLSKKLAARAGALRIEAESEVRSRMQAARDLAEAEQFGPALKKLDELDRIRYARLDGEVAALRRTLIEKKKRASSGSGEPEPEPEPRKTIGALLAKIDAAVERGDLARAERLARSAEGDDTYQAEPAQVRALLAVGRVLGRVATFDTKEPAELLKAHVGEELTLETREGRTVKGRLAEVRPGEVVLVKTYYVMKKKRQRRYTVDLDELAPETLERFSSGWKPETAHEHLAAAVIAAAGKDTATLEAELAAAPDHPLHGHYAAKLADLKQKLPELTAGKMWEAKIAPLAGKEDLEHEEVERLVKRLDRFELMHGKTEFARGRADRIAQLRETYGEKAGADEAREAERAAQDDWGRISAFVRQGRLTPNRALEVAKA